MSLSPNSVPWLPFETRRRLRDVKRDAVLHTAVRVFLERGYYRATLNEVAERLNITKPALYNYFRSKDEILFECWVMGQERVDRVISDIDKSGVPGLTKLRSLIRGYAEVMTTDFGASLVRFDYRDLTDENKATVRAGKRRIDSAFRAYIADGIADGSIRDCDAKLVAFAIAGSLNWIGHWYRPEGSSSADAIADEFADRLTQGLAPSGRKRTVRDDRKNKSQTGKT